MRSVGIQTPEPTPAPAPVPAEPAIDAAVAQFEGSLLEALPITKVAVEPGLRPDLATGVGKWTVGTFNLLTVSPAQQEAQEAKTVPGDASVPDPETQS